MRAGAAINLANEIAHTKTNAQKRAPGKRPLRDIYGYLLVRESYTKFPSSQRTCRCTVNCEPWPSRTITRLDIYRHTPTARTADSGGRSLRDLDLQKRLPESAALYDLQ